jgi:hypothetical protein
VDIEDLGQYLSEAVRSRIKDRIDFELPDEKAILDYLIDLLNNPLFRDGKVDDKLFPFTKETIDEIFKDLKGSASIRRYNEAFSLLIELADLDSHAPIDTAFYKKNKKEIIGWKE